MTTQLAPRRYQHVIEAAMERPWAILPSKLALIAEVLALRIDGHRFTDDEILERVGAKPKRASTQTGSVAVIPIYGSIIPRGASFSDVSMGQATSCEELIQNINAAAADGNVSSILLDVDSPGGQVDMVPEAAAAIRRARGKKPVVAVSNTMAASAAYWLASQATELVVSPSAEVGSIGVFAIHQDLSKQLEMLGVTPTIIKAGKYKAEMSPLAPLSPEATAYAQEGVDTFYSMFTRDVAAGRGAQVNDVRNGFGQGRMVTAQQAVSQGMADRVDTFDNTLARLMTAASGGSQARAAGMVVDPVAFTGDASVFDVLAAEGFRYFGGPIPYNNTDVVDQPWDGPGEEAKLPNPVTEARAKQMYAWQDTSQDAPDPDTKAAYSFPHHVVGSDGEPGAANVNGVRAALSRLPDSNVPEGDKPGVQAHLQKHLDKFHENDKASGEATSTPQDRLASLRQQSRAASESERETYLSLLRRINS